MCIRDRCCFGSGTGASVDISSLEMDCSHLDEWGALFGESMGRILVSVAPEHSDSFVAAMEGNSCSRMGSVEDNDKIMVNYGENEVLQASIGDLKKAWQGSLGGDA